MGGYVAFLDVLGFSSLVADKEEVGVAGYFDCLKRVGEATKIDYVVFSDSIVLTLEEEDPDELATMAGACSQLLHQMLQQGVAMRGAISFGPFLRRTLEDSVFVAGRAVIDAYQFEQKQDWVGVMIAPSARERVTDLEERCGIFNPTAQGRYEWIMDHLRWSTCIQHWPSIPFHRKSSFDESNFDGFAVVPTRGTLEPADLCTDVREAVDRLVWLRSIAPDPAAQQKHKRAIEWLGYVRQYWEQVTSHQRDRAR